MPVIATRARAWAASETGFTMLFAVMVLAVSMLVTAAIFTAVKGDLSLDQHTVNSQRAYGAATAGVNAFLYQLNQNPNYWSTCANDVQAKTAVPGSTSDAQYSYTYVPANGYATCSGTPPTPSMIDNATASLRMEFTGYAGGISRTIVASFRRASPLDFLWYTVYEALDKSISGYSGCGVFLRNGRASNCNIVWAAGDVMNGPMYTQDQYLIWGGATFGRNSNDKIESAAPGTNSSNICAFDNNGTITQDSCGPANLKGTPVPNAPTISPPANNTQLLTDAQIYGQTYTGTTTITLNGNSATVVNCPSTCTTSTVNLVQYPVLYVSNGANCTPYAYSPFNVTYSSSGCTGDVYVSGNYTTPLTIGAANNIIIDGSLTTTSSGPSTLTGNGVLGLIANAFIRVMHAVTYPDATCDNNSVNVANQTFSNMTIDAAMLAIQHSFIVDNYSCGASLGTLTVNGAIAQYFRGAVGTTGGTGYLKAYTYDDRMKVLAPPYLFDISTADWELQRETVCMPGGSSANQC
jgi:hypothetical protein